MKAPYQILLAVFLFVQAGLYAQDAPSSPLLLEVKAQKVIVVIEPDGTRSTSFGPVDKVLPGETVIYAITYSNSGERPAGNVVIDNPVPIQMVYLFGSAVGDGTDIEFSVDGATYAKPSDLKIALSSGGERVAEPEEYRSVRWRLLEEIPSGGSGSVSYRAVVSR